MHRLSLMLGTAAPGLGATPAIAADAPSDAQIAHIAYTAGNLDIAAARQALKKTRNAEVRSLADTMIGWVFGALVAIGLPALIFVTAQ